MFYLDRDPRNTVLDPGEGHRIARARLARLLHKLPHEIDAAPYQDVLDLLEVWRIDDELAKHHAKLAK